MDYGGWNSSHWSKSRMMVGLNHMGFLRRRIGEVGPEWHVWVVGLMGIWMGSNGNRSNWHRCRMVMHSTMVGYWCHYMMLLMVNVVLSVTMWMMDFMVALMMSMVINMSRMVNLLVNAVVTSMMMLNWMDCAMM